MTERYVLVSFDLVRFDERVTDVQSEIRALRKIGETANKKATAWKEPRI